MGLFLVFSGTRVGADKCFDLNKRGEEGANCGRDKFGHTPCALPYVFINIVCFYWEFILRNLLWTEVWRFVSMRFLCYVINITINMFNFFCRNIKCGSIFCGGGGESITGKRAAYTVSGIECKIAVDDDKNRNIDLVPAGTRCGTNKVRLPTGDT